MSKVWLLWISLGYPVYGFVAVPGIATEAACKQLAIDIEAGAEKKGTGDSYPFWTCVAYPARS
jgi:hypothetical protein